MLVALSDLSPSTGRCVDEQAGAKLPSLRVGSPG
jgi:hypothetical protein